MRRAALVCFDQSLETEALIGVLREFDEQLELEVISDAAWLSDGAPSRNGIGWLFVNADAAGLSMEEIVDQFGGDAERARIVAFGSSLSSVDVDRIMALGVAAYIPRRFTADATLSVLQLVRAGERFRPVADAGVDHKHPGAAATADQSESLRQFRLTKAEHDVLMLVAQGKTNLQIALELRKKEGTVRIQMSQIFRKLKVRNRSEAIIVAMREKSMIDAQMGDAEGKALDLAWLYPHMEYRRYRAGEVLFSQGDPGKELYVVQRGCVSLTQLGIEMHENDVFGEIAIFSPNHRRTSTAVCTTETNLFVLDEAKVRQIHYLNPAFALTVLKLITNRLLADRQRVG